MKVPTLNQCNMELSQIAGELAEAITSVTALEGDYTHRYHELLLISQRPSQPLREAEANEILRSEDIYVKYQEAKVKVRVLLMRKDIFMEISRNLRSYNYGA